MKNLIGLLVGMLLSSLCPAQSLSPTTLSNSGGSAMMPGGSLDWTLGEAVTETFVMPGNILTQGFQQPFGPYRVSGTMRYLNAAQSPMSNSVAYLQTLAGQTMDSALTTAAGKFYFFHAGAGTYKTKGKSTKTWGGANATDALLILKHFVNIAPLQGLYKKAGDVDNSGVMNSLDALLVARRFTGLISTFAAGDWRFSVDTAVVATVPDQQDMGALCNGDVNGSFSPGAKLSPNLALSLRGDQDCAGGMEIRLPLRAGQDFRAGAVSLVLAMNKEWFEVGEVMWGDMEGTLLWNQSREELRLAWYSISGVDFRAGDLVFELLLRTKEIEGIDPSMLVPTVAAGTEVAGSSGELLPQVELYMPRLHNVQAVEVAFFECCKPNPSSDFTGLSFGLAEPANLYLDLFDLPGKLIRSIDLGLYAAGTSSYTLDCSIYPPGTYLLRFRARGAGPAVEIVRKLVITR